MSFIFPGAPLPARRDGLKTTDDLLAEWRAADIAAANAEVIVTTALLRYSKDLGPPPDKAQTDSARQLRAVATTLLQEVLHQTGSVDIDLCPPDNTRNRRCFVRWGGSDWDPLGPADGEHTPASS